MSKHIRKFIAVLLCSIAVLLPNRLRVIFAEALGWITQFLYLNYYALLKFMLKELRKAGAQADAHEQN